MKKKNRAIHKAIRSKKSSKINFTSWQQAEYEALIIEKYNKMMANCSRLDTLSIEKDFAELYATQNRKAPKVIAFDNPYAAIEAIEEMGIKDEIFHWLRHSVYYSNACNVDMEIRSQASKLTNDWYQSFRKNAPIPYTAYVFYKKAGTQLEKIFGNESLSLHIDSSENLWNIAEAEFAKEAGFKIEEDILSVNEITKRISMQCEYWWPFKDVVIVSQKPVVLKVDENYRLHSENGKALEYSDGTGASVWHGKLIPCEWLKGSPPTVQDAMGRENKEERPAACEIVGWHKVLDELEAVEIDNSGNPEMGRLIVVELPDNGKEKFLDAINEVGQRYAVPVPPETKTVDEAHAQKRTGYTPRRWIDEYLLPYDTEAEPIAA